MIFHNLVAFYEHLMILIYQEYNFLLLENEISILNAFIDMRIFIKCIFIIDFIE